MTNEDANRGDGAAVDWSVDEPSEAELSAQQELARAEAALVVALDELGEVGTDEEIQARFGFDVAAVRRERLSEGS